MRPSMSRLTPQFSGNRMPREYTDDYYLPAASAYRRRTAGKASLAAAMAKWHISLSKHWHQVRFGQVTVQESSVGNLFRVEVYLGELGAGSGPS